MRLLWLVVFVQIVVESLPVSSSSHVRLLDMFFFGRHLDAMLPPCFDQLLHGPTVLIVLLFFRKQWWPLVRYWLLSLKSVQRDSSRRLLSIFFRITGLVVVCCTIPIVMRYGVIKPFLKHTSWFASDWTMIGGLVITSGALLSLKFLRSHPHSIRQQAGYSGQAFDFGLRPTPQPSPRLWRTGRANGNLKECFWVSALILGVVQACSLFPGISRFASTYVAARWLGWQPRRAFQVSFLIEFPLIVAGFGINGMLGLIKTPGSWALFSWEVLVALFVATVIGYVLLWLAWGMAQRKRLWWFGLYVWIPIVLLLFKQ